MTNPLRRAHFLMSETAHERLPLSEAEVAFIGRSNVGKSSLICALTENAKLARVSKTPGLTRGINLFEVKPGRWLVDLPGYGYAVGPKRQRNYWPEMIGRYLCERAAMKRVYVLVDASIETQKVDLETMAWLKQKNVPFHVVGAKIDRFGRDKHAAVRAKIARAADIDPQSVSMVSSHNGSGLPELRSAIAALLD